MFTLIFVLFHSSSMVAITIDFQDLKRCEEARMILVDQNRRTQGDKPVILHQGCFPK